MKNLSNKRWIFVISHSGNLFLSICVAWDWITNSPSAPWTHLENWNCKQPSLASYSQFRRGDKRRKQTLHTIDQSSLQTQQNRICKYLLGERVQEDELINLLFKDGGVLRCNKDPKMSSSEIIFTSISSSAMFLTTNNSTCVKSFCLCESCCPRDMVLLLSSCPDLDADELFARTARMLPGAGSGCVWMVTEDLSSSQSKKTDQTATLCEPMSSGFSFPREEALIQKVTGNFFTSHPPVEAYFLSNIRLFIGMLLTLFNIAEVHDGMYFSHLIMCSRERSCVKLVCGAAVRPCG